VSRKNTTRIQYVECRKVNAVPERLMIEEIQGMKYPQYGKKKKGKGAVQPKRMKAQPEEEAKENKNMRRTVRMITEV